MDSPQRIPRFGWVVAFLAATAVIGITWVKLKDTKPTQESALPVLGTVPEFTFQSQTNQVVSKKDLLGKIWIADFFFTRCPGPCPAMSSRMAELQAAIAKAGGNVHLVSVSVDPTFDTPAVLEQYAGRYNADPKWWTFLTGEPAKITEFVQKGMMLPLAKDGEDMPIHSQKFVVVDAEGRIRSYHDLDDPELVPKVLLDIGNLMREAQAKP